MVSAKKIESFNFATCIECLTMVSAKRKTLYIVAKSKVLTMVSAKRIESFDFATMYRVFNNGFS